MKIPKEMWIKHIEGSWFVMWIIASALDIGLFFIFGAFLFAYLLFVYPLLIKEGKLE